MPAFKYRQGDRPLDGFTIEYGLGRGGFGEVYYAISDSGRRVALKSVQNYEHIELRGIHDCMNLKSPHLVTIFDVKRNDEGEPFVIMEFMSGQSLRDRLDDAPEGLGETEAAFFLREIAKGLAYLHDHGIVHRDLKPHNVFFEDGLVKIGDYSLSKALTASHRSGHTMTVGTVHYMAPEISMGRYDSRVDIYALGIMLYEMLRGVPPFVGESMGEVLMKHVAGEVSVEGIAEPFASVIKTALAKDPTERYQTATDMARAVFGHQHIEDSVAGFNPQSLTQAAQVVGRKIAAGGNASAIDGAPVGSDAPTAYHPDSGKRVVIPQAAQRAGRAVGTRSHRTLPSAAFYAGRGMGLFAATSGLRFHHRRGQLESVSDPLGHPQRMTLAAMSAVVMTSGCILATSSPPLAIVATVADCVIIFSVIVGASIGLFGSGHWLLNQEPQLHGLGRRLVQTMSAGILSWAAMITSAFAVWMTSGHRTEVPLAAMLVAPLAPMLVLDWREMYSPIRRKRLSLFPLVVAAALALLMAAFLQSNVILAAGIAAGIAITVQVGSPFAQRRRRGRTATRPQRAKQHPPVEPIAAGGAQPAEAEPVQAAVVDDVMPPLAISSRSRAIALILAAVSYFTGICGLQRFYAGKYGTGFLYLITFGICGIGQLIDAVIILMGQFTDEHGRYIASWPGIVVPRGDASTPVNAWSSIPAPKPIGRHVAHFIGLGLLAIALTGGLLVATNTPQAILALERAEVVNLDIDQSLSQALATSDWAPLVQRLAALASGIVFLSAIAILLLARRHHGIAHVMRAVVGSCICVGAVFTVALLFQQFRWETIASLLYDGQSGLAVEQVIGSNDNLIVALIGGMTLLLGIGFLSWPATAAMDSTPGNERSETP